jgi:hypothetical protein
METLVITNCGKRIEFNETLAGLSWRYLINGCEKTQNHINKYKLIVDNFTNKTPSIAEVENAIVKQLPVILLEQSRDNPFYLLENCNYSSKSFEIREESIELSVPENCWEDIVVDKDIVESLSYISHSHKKGVYYNDLKEKVNLINNDMFLVSFYKEWAVLYRVYQNKETNTHKVLSIVMKNYTSKVRDLKKETYDKTTYHKTQNFRTITSMESKATILSNLKIRTGWLESSVMNELPTTPYAYINLDR